MNNCVNYLDKPGFKTEIESNEKTVEYLHIKLDLETVLEKAIQKVEQPTRLC